MSRLNLTDLIESGAHFGHLTRRWNPKMKKYIFMEKNGIHIIDLKKTQIAIDEACDAIRGIVSTGRSVLFVGTKKQAGGVIATEARRSESNWVSERWLGGMLTNFATIRKSIKRLQNIDKMETDGTFEKITKKEILQLTREKDKLRKVLEGVETLGRMPGALFVVDIKKEAIAIREALRLNIPIFAMVDTNCDPDPIDFVIPSNDDAVRAIEVITKKIADAVIEGQAKAKELKAEEAAEKERQKKIKEEETPEKQEDGKATRRKVKFDSRGQKRSDRTERSDKKNRPEAKQEKAVPAPEVKKEAPAEKTAETPKKEEAPVQEVKKAEVPATGKKAETPPATEETSGENKKEEK